MLNSKNAVQKSGVLSPMHSIPEMLFGTWCGSPIKSTVGHRTNDLATEAEVTM